MADQIQAQWTASAANLYAVVRKPDGTVWNGSAFVTYATANLGDYDLPMTEQGTASRYYAVNIPALAAGAYMVTVFVRAGGSPAETDSTVGTGRLEWSGTAEIPLSGVGLDAAGVRAAIGMASANLDTQIAAIGGGGGGEEDDPWREV